MNEPRLLGEFRKAIAALTSVAAVVTGAGLITGSLAVWITGGIAAAAAGLAAFTATDTRVPVRATGQHQAAD